MSFRTVTLPPETPGSRRSGLSQSVSRRSTMSKVSRTPSRKSLELSISDDLPNNMNFEMFESSEEDFIIDAHNFSSDEGVSDDGSASRRVCRPIAGPSAGVGPTGGGVVIGLESRGPSIRRVGSRQMLVFLSDGNSIGNVNNYYNFQCILISSKRYVSINLPMGMKNL